MKTYLIADTHFNHKNIIEYCDRPFKTVKEMNEAMILKWNNTVSKSDIVYFLGDFAMGNKQTVKEFCQKLNGRKFLVKGNHDGYSIPSYMECGFEKVYDKPIIYNNFFILSHEPMFLTENMPYANIFGHVHNDPKYASVSGNSFCVSVERINYTPILFDTIVEKMKEHCKEGV